MAKAKKAAPMKACPECKAEVHAATKTCKCGHIFSAAASKNGKGRKAAKGVDVEKEAMRIVLANKGNPAAVLKMIEDYQQPEKTRFELFLENAGGKEKAREAIEALKSSLAKE